MFILSIIFGVALLVLSLNLLFNPNSPKYEGLFNSGKVPDTLLETDGKSQEWSIRMLTGPILSLNFWPFNHRKKILNLFGHDESGYNIFFKDFRWGWFLANDIQNNSKLLDYSYPFSNGFGTSRIQDLVRATLNPDIMIGKFYYRIFGKYRFLGYFSMERINKNA